MEISLTIYIVIIILFVLIPHLLRGFTRSSLNNDIFFRCLVAPLMIFLIWKTYSSGRFYSYIVIIGDPGAISLIGFIGLIVFLISYAISFYLD